MEPRPRPVSWPLLLEGSSLHGEQRCDALGQGAGLFGGRAGTGACDGRDSRPPVSETTEAGPRGREGLRWRGRPHTRPLCSASGRLGGGWAGSTPTPQLAPAPPGTCSCRATRPLPAFAASSSLLLCAGSGTRRPESRGCSPHTCPTPRVRCTVLPSSEPVSLVCQTEPARGADGMFPRPGAQPARVFVAGAGSGPGLAPRGSPSPRLLTCRLAASPPAPCLPWLTATWSLHGRRRRLIDGAPTLAGVVPRASWRLSSCRWLRSWLTRATRQ